MSSSDCVIPEIEAADYFHRLQTSQEAGRWLPIAGSMELTLACNLRCRHCYVRYPGAAHGEMTAAETCRILDKVAAAGALFLLLTGGDPLIRGDFKEIYLHIKRLGLIPTLFTNAARVTPDLADFLAEWPPRRIEVTIYGHTAATYEEITGVHGSFHEMRRGLDLLLARGLRVAAKTIVMRSNRHEFEAIRDWARERGLRFRYDPVINPRLNGDLASTAERLEPAEAAHLLDAQVTKQTQIARPAIQPQSDRQLPLFLCGAGIKSFHIDPQGRLHPCLLWRADPYDLRTRPLDEEWQTHLAAIRNRCPTEEECTRCAVVDACGRCPPLSLLETGRADRKVPYHCAIGKARRR